MDEHLLRFNKDKTFVFLDYESFNLCLSFCHNLPWQIAMMKVVNGQIVESYDRYIKWKTHLKISDEAAKITKFDQKKFDAEAVSSEEVYPVMKQWLTEADYIVGHNILGFDIYLIKEWFLLNKDNPRELFKKVICTNVIAKAIGLDMTTPDKNRHLLEFQYPILHTRKRGLKTRLEFLGKEYKIEHDYDNLHNALVDLSLNVKVWNKQKFSIEV